MDVWKANLQTLNVFFDLKLTTYTRDTIYTLVSKE